VKAIIVEDEAIASRRLKRLCDEIEDHDIEILAVFESVQETAAYLLENEHPEILFLDIHLSDGNSFELFNIIEHIHSSIIFTTAYSEYGPQAFRKKALDYLLKPIKKEELIDALNRKKALTKEDVESIKTHYNDFKNRFLIRFGAKLHIVRTDEIAYIYSKDKISYFILKSGKKIPSDFRLQDLETMLDPDIFFRANRQLIVYIDAIGEIITYTKSRVKLRLSPPYKEKEDLVVSTENTPRLKLWLDR
jgi:two-component system LytT family response regulator